MTPKTFYFKLYWYLGRYRDCLFLENVHLNEIRTGIFRVFRTNVKRSHVYFQRIKFQSRNLHKVVFGNTFLTFGLQTSDSFLQTDDGNLSNDSECMLFWTSLPEWSCLNPRPFYSNGCSSCSNDDCFRTGSRKKGHI